MPWGRLGAAIKPIHISTPITAPWAKALGMLDHTMILARMNDRTRSPRNEAVMPSSRPSRLPGSRLTPINSIQGLANRGGEYQAAPSTQRMIAETRMARWFRDGKGIMQSPPARDSAIVVQSQRKGIGGCATLSRQ